MSRRASDGSLVRLFQRRLVACGLEDDLAIDDGHDNLRDASISLGLRRNRSRSRTVRSARHPVFRMPRRSSANAAQAAPAVKPRRVSSSDEELLGVPSARRDGPRRPAG